MKNISPKAFIIITLFVIFSLTFISLGTTHMNLNQTRRNLENGNSEIFNNLQSSPSASLNHDDHAEIHGYADQYIGWSFSTLPSQIIHVWALEAFQYSLWTSGLSASGHLLSTSSSDSGTFNVPTGSTWYIVFWNDMTGSQNTIVLYNANFVGDSRPPSLTVYKPYGSYYPGETLPIDWSSVNAGSSVSIELYKGATLYTTISSSTSNDGYSE